MAARPKSTTPQELRGRLHDGGEIAIVDAREEGSFHHRHLLMASCLPLSRLELVAPALLPRRSAPVVVCDDDAGGGGLAERAAARLIAGGWSDVSGPGRRGRRPGRRRASRSTAGCTCRARPSPRSSSTKWARLGSAPRNWRGGSSEGEKLAIFDSRSYEEYHSNSIPGAISVPGAELVYRFHELVASPDTFVVVNCGGRTRSIIGAQALIDAGVPNRVVSLKDGTMAWHLAGLDVVNGATGRAPEVSAEGVATARERADAVARRYGVPAIDRATLAQWQREADRRTLYVLDVRDPAEYRAGHLPGSLMAPGGQLVQETDSWLGIWGARVVLVDDTGVRSRDHRLVAPADGLGCGGARPCSRRRRVGARRPRPAQRCLSARRARAGGRLRPPSCAPMPRPSSSIWHRAAAIAKATSPAHGSRSGRVLARRWRNCRKRAIWC